MNSGRYCVVLASLVATAIAPLLGLWFWLEPLNGDSTRLGWYSERDFGWNVPQQVFSRSAVTLAAYDRYHDVVVYGDSFSKSFGQSEEQPTQTWPNYLTAFTGLSVAVVHHRDASVLEVINSETFRKSPPKFFIYQQLERYLANLTNMQDAKNQCASARTVPAHELAYTPRALISEWQERPRVSFDINLGYPRKYLVNATLRRFFGWEPRDIKRLGLNTKQLFSNRASDSLLVFKDEFNRFQWKREDVERSYCSVARLRSMVQANGMTQFILLLAPDKLTVYSKYLTDQTYAGSSWLESFLDTHDIEAPRLAVALQRAVDSGLRDVYRPNDTHWGYHGNEIAARVVAEFLKQKNIDADAGSRTAELSKATPSVPPSM